VEENIFCLADMISGCCSRGCWGMFWEFVAKKM